MILNYEFRFLIGDGKEDWGTANRREWTLILRNGRQNAGFAGVERDG
jgi:hypothetical protein